MANSTMTNPFRLTWTLGIFALVLFLIFKFGIIGLLVVLITLFLIRYEHPKSTSRIMAEDALPIDMPRTGGEGKSVVVVGGGISGLSAAKYLIQAGCDVTLLEKREIVGGNNDPYLENGEHHATTVIILHCCKGVLGCISAFTLADDLARLGGVPGVLALSITTETQTAAP